jgi:HAD superfamily hydrolase (TIGR01509 family)
LADHDTITPECFEAVLFDLDGVLTATEKVHAACWKRMFDDYLRTRAGDAGRERLPGSADAFRPFDIETDYKMYVDGRPRYDGVETFLESRGMRLPHGDPDGPAGTSSVSALGNLKDEMVNAIFASEGVEIYDDAIAVVRYVLDNGMRTGVVSSSNSCAAVLRVAGIAGLFEVRIDGEVATERNLPGKPAPDTFLAAARELGVEPTRTAIVEDAIAGVQAGRDGGFGLVIGVDRKGDPDALRQHGAHVVVADLRKMIPGAGVSGLAAELKS